jgi:hypothetical protein
MNISRKVTLYIIVVMISLLLIFSGCSAQILKVSISDVYYLRNNHIDENFIFDIYTAEIILENSSVEQVNFVSKHVEDAQGRSYKANFTYEENWGESCTTTCSSDAKFLDAETVKPGYFEVIGEMPLDATVLRAYIEIEEELLVFSLPDPGELEIREVIVHSE